MQMSAGLTHNVSFLMMALLARPLPDTAEKNSSTRNALIRGHIDHFSMNNSTNSLSCKFRSAFFRLSLFCTVTCVHSLVRSLPAGVQPTLDPSAETFLIGPMRQAQEEKGI